MIMSEEGKIINLFGQCRRNFELCDTNINSSVSTIINVYLQEGAKYNAEATMTKWRSEMLSAGSGRLNYRFNCPKVIAIEWGSFAGW